MTEYLSFLDKDNKRENETKRGRGVFYWIISTTFLLFLFVCILSMVITFFIFIMDGSIINKYFGDLYTSIADPSNTIGSEKIKEIQAVENAYKSARTFDLMSFFYMFISSILIGLMVYFYNEMNSFRREHEYITMEFKEFAEQTKESIETFQRSTKNYEGIIALNEISNTAFEANSLLGIVESMCIHQTTVSQERIKDYIPRLRDKLNQSSQLLEKLCSEPQISLAPSYTEFLAELFYTFPEKLEKIAQLWPGIIQDSTKDEFLGYIDKCKKSLKILRKSSDKK